MSRSINFRQDPTSLRCKRMLSRRCPRRTTQTTARQSSSNSFQSTETRPRKPFHSRNIRSRLLRDYVGLFQPEWTTNPHTCCAGGRAWQIAIVSLLERVKNKTTNRILDPHPPAATGSDWRGQGVLLLDLRLGNIARHNLDSPFLLVSGISQA